MGVSYRLRLLILVGLAALPLLLLSILGAARYLAERERAVSDEQLAVARAVAGAAQGFLEADTTAVRAIAALPAVRDFARVDGETLDRAMLPIFGAFPQLETLGLIGPDGWNERSLTRNVPAPPRTINVADRPYFRQALETGQIVVSPAVLSRLRPGVPVVAIAVPIRAPDGTPGPPIAGVLVGTVSLGEIQQAMQSVNPDPNLGVVLVDSDGQALVGPRIDPAATRALVSLRGRPDVDAALAGEAGSRQVRPLRDEGGDLLVGYAPVRGVGWGALIQQPAAAALAPARWEAARSIGLILIVLAFSLGLAWFLGGRLARSYRQLDAARAAAERGRERSAFLAEYSRQLATTLDYQTTLETAARLVIPVFADWCLVDLVAAGSPDTHRLVVAQADAAMEPLAQALRDHSSADVQAETGVGRVIRTGEPLLVEDITDAGLELVARDEEHLRLLRAIGPRSTVIAPLRGRGGVLGAMTFLLTGSDRRYSPDDAATAQDLANRAALAMENARLFAEVQAALRTRDEFLAAASHDLKNPLAAVRMQVQLLHRRAERSAEIAAGEIIQAADRIDGVIQRATDLVDELLDVTRLQLGQPLDLAREPVDLVGLVHEAVADAVSTSGRHRLRVEAPDQPVVGLWDSRRLRRVVDNLLSNAIKYSPEGGDVIVSIGREIEERLDRAVLSIRDFGIGIPKDDLPRLFERFRRGANVMGRVAGTGIGLASARHLVESHGGTITLDSTEGHGTLVVVHLPLSAEPLPDAA